MEAVVLLGDYQREVKELELEDLYGLEYEKIILGSSGPFAEMDEALLLPNSRLFLFSGPDGYGKHTLADAYAYELSQLGYEYYVIDGELLAEAGNSADALRVLFENLLKLTTPVMADEVGLAEHKKCFVLFDRFETLCADKKACGMISRMFALLNSDNPDFYFNHLVIGGITTDLCAVPDSVRVHMHVLELQVPAEEERMEFFKDELTVEMEDEENETVHSFIPVDAGVPEVYLADLTTGFSFGELRKAAMQIKMFYKQTMHIKHKGSYRKVLKEVKESKSFVSQDHIELIIDRIKREKEL